MNTAGLVSLIRRLPAAQLHDAAPGLRADLAHDLREEFASWVARQHHPDFGSWQEAWNRWARVARDRRVGTVTVSPRVCPECRGRRFNTRTFQLGLTCCGGTRRPPSVPVTARWLDTA